MRAYLETIEQLSSDTYKISFKPEQNLDYTAGQFVEVTLNHPNPDNRGVKRWFTLSSAPEESLLMITTKQSAQSSSFKNALFALQSGDNIEVSQAMGDFVLPRQRTIPVMFIAAGIGITPARSIVTSLQCSGVQRDISLLYISGQEHPVYEKEIESYTNNVEHIQSGPNALNRCVKQIQQITLVKPGLLVYLSGPEAFVESAVHHLKPVISPARVVTDYFHGYTA